MSSTETVSATPVTADWLLSLGGKKDGRHYVGIPCEGMYLWFYVEATGGIDARIEWDGGYLPGEYRTRGQVVRLLAAFGIPLPT